ncbi:MAG: hypothetical protein PHF40_01450 [Candidatus Pacebacteria bacterium]|nr:hypothetical protein [Candidatus Paceibacterota bacterium]
MAIWERVSADIQREWICKSAKGLVDGIQIDQQRQQIKAQCALTSTNEIIPVVQLGRRPDWFRLSLRVPQWVGIVGVANGHLLLPVEKDNYKLLFFRNATVVELVKGRLRATYLAVRAEGTRFCLVEVPRFELEIPRFIETREGIRDFLVENHIPQDLLEPALALIQNQKKDFSNPSWKEGLRKAKLQPSPKVEAPKKEIRSASKEPQEIPDVDDEPEKIRRSPKKREDRREREDKPRRPRPHQLDDSEVRGARGLSMKDFQN